MTTPLTITRDLIRFRKFESNPLSTLSNFLFTLLTSPSPSSILLRSSFIPAYLNSMNKPRDSNLLKEIDLKLLNLFENPPNVCIIQGSISSDLIDKAWSNVENNDLKDKIFISFALNSELLQAKEDGEKEIEANLSGKSLMSF